MNSSPRTQQHCARRLHLGVEHRPLLPAEGRRLPRLLLLTQTAHRDNWRCPPQPPPFESPGLKRRMGGVGTGVAECSAGGSVPAWRPAAVCGRRGSGDLLALAAWPSGGDDVV
nr:unnamed protein product [Digitaria exilis]